jgi:cardiolipin synthase
MMFEFKGTMAQSLQDSFTQVWNDTTGEVLSGPLFYPMLTNTPNTNSFIGITSIPSGDYEPVRDAFLLTALSAQKNLYIVASYIIPDEALLNVLEDRARAGVDVRIVSPGKNTVAPVLRAVWHMDYEQLLTAGVKIYEYQPSMIHTKFMIADDTWSLVGSANVDNRSEALNSENVVGISDPALAKTLDGTFMDYLSRSKQITLADWKTQYGFFSRLYSRLLLVLQKQY